MHSGRGDMGSKCIMADMGVMDDVDLAMMIHCNPAKTLYP